MLESHASEAVIKIALSIDVKTKVKLIGRDYTGIGIVRSCRKDGKNFILTIQVDANPRTSRVPLDRDPGVLAVDTFLTEEEEEKILNDLEDWTPRRRLSSKCLWLVPPRSPAIS